MGLTVSTVAPTLDLTTLAAVKAELGGTFSAGDDAVLSNLITQASSGIVSHCRRPFARESYTETLGGYGDIRLQLARTPLAEVTALTIMSNVVTDFGIEDADKGWLYMRCWAGTSSFSWQRTQFPWTAGRYVGLSGSGAWLDQGTPLPRQEMPSISVDYTAGYILPSQFLVAKTTISASAIDNSFNDSASGFPALLKAGDIIEPSGFVATANNRRWLVTGTPTTAKVIVSGTVTTEAAGASVTVKFRPPSSHRSFDDVEKACIEAVKTWWLSRNEDSSIVEKHAGPMGLRYGEGNEDGALPPTCVGLLRHWVRAA